MKVKFLVILLSLFFNQSYSQEFGEIEIDKNLQIKYQDTLQGMGDKLSGHWKYLGKRDGRILMDTLSTNNSGNKKHSIIIEKGVVFEVENNIRTKTDYYFETVFDFKDEIGFYSNEKKYLNNEIIDVTSNQPFVALVYYKEQFGVLFSGMVGQYFKPIRFIYNKKLIFENGEEYRRIQ